MVLHFQFQITMVYCLYMGSWLTSIHSLGILQSCYDCLIVSESEKAMAPHSSTLAWKIPWTEKPGRLQSMGSLRVGHDWAASLSLFTFMHWRRKCQLAPVFLPGESQGRGSLVGCRLWGRTWLKRLSSSSNSRDFFGGPVVRTVYWQCWGRGFKPWLGN